MAGRVTVEASVQVNRPPGEVFEYLTDVARHGEWSPRPYRVEGMAPGDHVVTGSRYTSFGWLPGDKDHRNDVEATEVTASERLVLTSTESGGQFVNTFTLTPSGGGTSLRRVMDFARPGGALGLIFPVLQVLLIRPDVNKGLGKLKARLEAPS